MKINQHKLQTSFLQPDLLTVSSFVSYCRDNGLSTDEAELEYFEKEKLLVPAIRVLMGVLEYRFILSNFDGKEEWRHIYSQDINKFKVKKLDPKKYYGRGALIQSVPGLGNIRGFHFGNDGWMDWYLERSMVRYPAIDGYIAWERFEEPDKQGQIFGNDPKLFEEVSELMYAKHQIYPLRFIKAQRTDFKQTHRILKVPEGRPRAGDFVLSDNHDELPNKVIQQRVVEWNRFFDFLIEVRKLRLGKHQKINEVYMQSMRESDSNRKEAVRDVESAAELYDKQAKKAANILVSSHKLSIQNIEDWRYKILGHGSFGTGEYSRVFRTYVSRLDNSLLNRNEDAYATVNELSWFIELLGGQGLNAKQLILQSLGDTCKYCGRQFQPTRNTQVTCGATECKQKQRNEHKREARIIAKARGSL